MINYLGTAADFPVFIANAIAEAEQAEKEMDRVVAVTARDTAAQVFDGFDPAQQVRATAIWDVNFGFHMSLQKM
jgi:hypothetical protein